MGRRAIDENRYVACANYVVGIAISAFHSHDDALQRVTALTDAMRRDGATSEVRNVRVWHWPENIRLAEAPVVFEASYYDPEQRLTTAETYAARVHDWHASVDESNRKAAARNSTWGYARAAWSDAWGPEPDSCPMCDCDFTKRP